jgi:hypothetical protein
MTQTNPPRRRHSTPRSAALTGAAAIALAALAGCSGSNTTNNSGPTSATSQTSSATPSPTSTPTPSATVTYKPGDPVGMGAWAVLGLVSTRTAEERAVAEAYLRMDQVSLEAFNTHVVDEAALESVLEGTALKNTKAQIQWRVDNKLWTVDRSTLNVLSVQITGAKAVLRACNFDGTAEVDKSTHIVVQPPGSTGAIITMVQRGGVWRASEGRKDPVKCDAVTIMQKLKTTPPTTR